MWRGVIRLGTFLVVRADVLGRDWRNPGMRSDCSGEHPAEEARECGSGRGALCSEHPGATFGRSSVRVGAGRLFVVCGVRGLPRRDGDLREDICLIGERVKGGCMRPNLGPSQRGR